MSYVGAIASVIAIAVCPVGWVTVLMTIAAVGNCFFVWFEGKENG